jgi:hypothetical protein
LKANLDSTAKADEITTTATRAAAQGGASIEGRTFGWLSIATGAAAAVVHPMVAIAGFFLALMGLTVAAPSQRLWSILGIAASVAGFAIGKLTGFSLI